MFVLPKRSGWVLTRATPKVTTRQLRAQGEPPPTNDARTSITANEERGIFRVLDIGKPQVEPFNPTKVFRREKPRPKYLIEREKEMSPHQDWEAVWPTFRTFHPSVVPLPIRQGYVQTRDQVHSDKKANVELMKIPNFLHLTPPVIQKHCQILKSFCTPWPKGDVAREFPLVETTSAYLNSSSSIRDNRARIVSLEVPLKSLKLTPEAKEKFIRLCQERYNPTTDAVTIVCDSCPHRKQNQDYASYLLTTIYHESYKKQSWESSKTEKDMFDYTWSLRVPRSKQQRHLQAVEMLINAGENRQSLETYKEAVLDLLKIESGGAAEEISQ